MTDRSVTIQPDAFLNLPAAGKPDVRAVLIPDLLTPTNVDRYLSRVISKNETAIEHLRRAPVGILSRLIDRAIDLGVFGVVETRLQNAGLTLPRLLHDRLQCKRQRTEIQNRHRLTHALRLVERLDAAEIPYVLLKGAALIACGAAEITARPMTDVDILIRAQDASQVDRIINEHGGRAGADLVQADFYPRFHYEREYLIGTPPVKIDLHVRAFRPTLFAMRTPVDAFLQNCETVKLLGQRVRIPSPTTMLIHLAVHAACHGGKHLRWLHDVYHWSTFKQDRIDAQDVARLTTSWRLTAPLHLALTNVGDVFDAPTLVRPYLDALSQRLDPLASLTLAQASRALERPAYDAWINAMGVPSWHGKWQYLAAVGLPSETHLREHYRGSHVGWRWIAHAMRLGKRVIPRRTNDAA